MHAYIGLAQHPTTPPFRLGRTPFPHGIQNTCTSERSALCCVQPNQKTPHSVAKRSERLEAY